MNLTGNQTAAAASVDDITATAIDNAAAAAVAPQGIELEVPIQRGSQTITHVQLRRPNAGELRGLNLIKLTEMDADQVMGLLPRISSPTLMKHEIDAMHPADLVILAVAVSNFFATNRMVDLVRGAKEGMEYQGT